MTKLERYFRILSGEEKSNYLKAKLIPLRFYTREDLTALWEKHDTHQCCSEGTISSSFFDIKLAIARKMFHQCHFCEHRCQVDRGKEEGICKTQEAKIASEFLHHGEESILVPSYTIFFSGCTFKCVYCQNWDISQEECGTYIEPLQMAEMIEMTPGINVNWVGGDPTPNLYYIFEVLKICTKNIPQVWNSNMYCSLETMKLLRHVMDVYLTDFKYGNNHCARRLSKIEKYWEVITRNHLVASEQGEILIRHLVLPNHIDCCSKPILEWISKHLPFALVNIMAQYRPCYQAYQYEDISRPLHQEEYRDVLQYAEELQLCLI